MKKSFVSKYIKNKYSIIGVIVLAILVYYFFFTGETKKVFDFAIAKYGDIEERVSVTGKVSPIEKADLAFEKSGRITNIKIKVGDRVNKGDVLATLDSNTDRANLNSALAKLADMTRSLNAPELASEESKVSTYKIAMDNAKKDALNTGRTALALTQSAIFNYADTFFDNPQSANPTINIRTDSPSLENSINQKRAGLTDILNKWKIDLANATTSDKSQSLIDSISQYEIVIKSFVDDLNTIVSNLNTSNSGLTRSVIDTKVTQMNTALTTLNQAIASVSNTKTALDSAISSYNQSYSGFVLKSSGSSAESILAQRSVVEAYRAELDKNTLKAPISGTVTKVSPELGEYVNPGSIQFSIISEGQYKVEAYVPEADIAKIKIGDKASTTLDAYGQDIDFATVVTFIDPAETILEGVPTYKITLQFVYQDSRIRSGMTANLDIKTNERKNVLIIPTRAVVLEGNEKSTRLVNQDGKDFSSIPLKVGLKGSDGMTEVISGLREGDKVVTYIK